MDDNDIYTSSCIIIFNSRFKRYLYASNLLDDVDFVRLRMGGLLNFGLGISVRREAPNIVVCRADQRQIWGLDDMIFF